MGAAATATRSQRGCRAQSAVAASDGWETLGDMGWLDEDGFLYLVERKSDMILVGGANVSPAEIEAALALHPTVRSSAVIGLQLAGFGPASWQFNAGLAGLNVVCVLLLLYVLDRGRIISPAYSRLDPRHLERLRGMTAARNRQNSLEAR